MSEFAALDAALRRLEEKREAWGNTDIPERVELLQRCQEGIAAVSERWVAACCNAKGIPVDSPISGEEWLSGPFCVQRNLRQLIDALRAGGAPRPPHYKRCGDDQLAAQVFPDNSYDSALYTGFKAEVWLRPGQEPVQGQCYRRKEHDEHLASRIALILGAGNVSSIGAMDVLHKLFVADEVVILKTHPVNAYLGDLLREAFAPLCAAGVLAIVAGGADAGEYLCTHELVETIHITGSDKTHHAIVWGSDEHEAAARKGRGEPLNQREITSELGCVSPILIVPGRWSTADLVYHARQVASAVVNNASFNCNAAKVLVTAAGWPQRQRFLQLVADMLAAAPRRPAYYPGAGERHQAFVDHYPQAQQLGDGSVSVGTDSGVGPLLPWTLISEVAATKGEYALSTEAFCGILAEISVDADTPRDFLRLAPELANNAIWGNLSCGLLIDPKTARAWASELAAAIAALRYGGISVNAWAGIMYGLCSPTWGAYPGNTLSDIQSGRGVVHNTYLFESPQKSVLYAPFRVRPKPLWFYDHRHLLPAARHLTKAEQNPSWWGVLKVAGHAMMG